jgi:hypothetical protein
MASREHRSDVVLAQGGVQPPLDLIDVGTFGLAPQSPSSGRLTISRIVVVK